MKINILINIIQPQCMAKQDKQLSSRKPQNGKINLTFVNCITCKSSSRGLQVTTRWQGFCQNDTDQ